MASQIWARVRDKATGHHFDVPLGLLQRLLDRDAVEEVVGPRHPTCGARHRGQPCPPKLQRPLKALVPPVKRAAKAAVTEQKESESA